MSSFQNEEYIMSKLGPAMGLPPGSMISIRGNVQTCGYIANVSGFGRIDIHAVDSQGALLELVAKVRAMVTSRAKATLRPGRHDRGWPKVAA